MNDQFKTVVSVSEMARMVGLSRQRMYQLIGKSFPTPLYNVKTKRPFYTEELQKVCLEVRQRNCGVDGIPILFYQRRTDCGVVRTKQKQTKPKPRSNQHDQIVESLKALGLQAAPSQVEVAMKNLFPNGTKNVDDAEVVREVFLHLQKSGSKNEGN